MANVEAFFSHCSCLTLVPFLCLLVTSDLPLGVFCAQQQQSKAAFPLMADLMHGLDLASETNIADSSPSKARTIGFSARGFTPTGSYYLPDEPATTNSQGSPTSRLDEATLNNQNIDILILPKTNRQGPSSPLALHAEGEGDSRFARGASIIQIHSSTRLSRPRRASSNGKTNTFINGGGSDAESTTRRVASTNVNNMNEPSTYSTVNALNNEIIESPRLAEQVEERLLDPLPVAYLTSSQDELEPPLISNPAAELSKDSLVKGRNRNFVAEPSKDHFVYRSDKDSKSRLASRATNLDNLDISLLVQNSNDDESAPNVNQEIASNMPTTFSPMMMEGTVAMIVEQVPTSLPAEGEEQVTDSNISIDDNDNPNNTTEEPGTIPLRGKCNETSQCFGEHVECRLSICKCQLGYLPRVDNGELCGEASAHHVEVPTTDPTMIGVVVGLALMSVTLCIVLRLFAKARFRENRTIFNTPNPRLMNVSLLKGSKTLLRGNSAGQRSRRGSQASVASGGQGEVQSPSNPTAEGNGAGSSSHPHRVKPSRTLSTDTTNLEGTPTSSRPLTSNRSKFRQDSVASNV